MVSHQSQQTENNYIFHYRNRLELARLIHQDRAITQECDQVHFLEWGSSFRNILDIGCGPGGWCLDLAAVQPDIHVIGIDINPEMIQYAQMLAYADNRKNVIFQQMDARQSLITFPDESFDFINLRFANSFLKKDEWPVILKECYRLLTPKGVVRCMDLEMFISTSAAQQQAMDMFIKGSHLTGIGFSSLPEGGRGFGITYMYSHLLQAANFQNIKLESFVVDCSYHTPNYHLWKENATMISHLILPLLIDKGVTTSEEWQNLQQQIEVDMENSDYCGMSYDVIVWGTKPSPSGEKFVRTSTG